MVCPHPVAIYVHNNNIQRSSSLKSFGQSKPNFIGSINGKWESLYMFINNPGHMIKMAAVPIQGKNPSKIFLSRTAEPIAMKLDMLQLGLEYYNIFINHDLVMTLTNLKARST